MSRIFNALSKLVVVNSFANPLWSFTISVEGLFAYLKCKYHDHWSPPSCHVTVTLSFKSPESILTLSQEVSPLPSVNQYTYPSLKSIIQ